MTTKERRALLYYAAWLRGDAATNEFPIDGSDLMPSYDDDFAVIRRAHTAESLAYDNTDGPETP